MSGEPKLTLTVTGYSAKWDRSEGIELTLDWFDPEGVLRALREAMTPKAYRELITEAWLQVRRPGTVAERSPLFDPRYGFGSKGEVTLAELAELKARVPPGAWAERLAEEAQREPGADRVEPLPPLVMYMVRVPPTGPGLQGDEPPTEWVRRSFVAVPLAERSRLRAERLAEEAQREPGAWAEKLTSVVERMTGSEAPVTETDDPPAAVREAEDRLRLLRLEPGIGGGTTW